MRAFLALPVLVAVLAFAGCGSSSSDKGSSSSGSSSPATPSGGVTAGAVKIKDFAFDPDPVTAKVGQKITWTNEDSVAHNVIADDGTFKSATMNQGDTYSFTPKKAGTFSYVCTFHAQMKATLTVTG